MLSNISSNHTISATFSYSGSSTNSSDYNYPVYNFTTNEPHVNGQSGWTKVEDEINNTPEGGKIKVSMNGTSTLPQNILSNIMGKDIDLIIKMGNGTEWILNGKDIPDNWIAKDIDLSIKTGSDSIITKIPIRVIDELGEEKLVYAELGFDGEFGFKMTLRMNVGKEFSGKYANLYYYNENGKLELLYSVKIESDGTVMIPFNHTSSYVISITKVAIMNDREDIAAGAGFDGEEDTVPDDDALTDDIPTDVDAKLQEKKPT